MVTIGPNVFHGSNMVEQTAKCCDLTLRKALLAKSGPAVFDIIANSPINKHRPRTKNIGTRTFLRRRHTIGSSTETENNEDATEQATNIVEP